MSVTPSLAASVLSGLGAALNNLLFLAQAPLMMRMVREGSSEGYSWAPSIALLTLFCLWSGYTVFILPTAALYAGNFPGMVVPFVNLCLFVVYASSIRRRLVITCATLLCIGSTWGLACGLFLGAGVTNSNNIFSGIVSAVTLLYFISPLLALAAALKSLDTSRVPLLLSCVQLIQSAVWVAAGVLLFDNFITGLNAVGFAFAVGQLVCYFVIRSRIRRRDAALALAPKSVTDDVEDDRALPPAVAAKSVSSEDILPAVADATASAVISVNTPPGIAIPLSAPPGIAGPEIRRTPSPTLKA